MAIPNCGVDMLHANVYIDKLSLYATGSDYYNEIYM